jgi:hypothetical protein
MFLEISDVGAETTYQLGSLTRAFVLEQSRRLDRFNVVKERVEQYKKNIYPENSGLTRLRDKIEKLLYRASSESGTESLKTAWVLVQDTSLGAKITEDPRFISFQGYVAVRQHPPRLDDARRLFADAVSMKYDPSFDQLKAWFYAERESGFGFNQCIKIVEIVLNGRRYTEEEKIDVLSRKATLIYNRAKEERFINPTRAIEDLKESLKIHLTCFVKSEQLGLSKAQKSEGYCRNTLFMLSQYLLQNSQYDELFRSLTEIFNIRGIKVDCLEEPIIGSFQWIQDARVGVSELQKFKNKIEQFSKMASNGIFWIEPQSRIRVMEAAEKAQKRLLSRTQQGRPL